MKLKSALTGLARKEIKAEHDDLIERIAELRAILADEQRLMDVIREELLEIKNRFDNPRRTEIIAAEGEIDLEQLIAEEDMVISITASGYIKRLPLGTYRTQGRGGIGVMGMDLKEGDYIEHLFVASTHDYLLFFTTVGKVYRVKVHELPLGTRQAKGRALVNVLPLRQDEYVKAVIDTRTHTRSGEIDLPGEMVRPMGLVISPDGHTLYVSGGRGKTVHVVALDGAEPRVKSTIADAGMRPWGIGITQRGDRLYTANGPSGDVSVIDTATGAVSRRITVGGSPWGVAIR